MTEQEKNMFGISREDIDEMLAESSYENGLKMALSFLSDAQEIISRGDTAPDWRNRARLQINIAKYLIDKENDKNYPKWYGDAHPFNPRWELKTKVHDWRNYISEEVQKIWDTFSASQKFALAKQALIQAEKEVWD